MYGSHVEWTVVALYFVSFATLKLCFSEFSPMWFWIRVGHKRYLCEILEVKWSCSLVMLWGGGQALGQLVYIVAEMLAHLVSMGSTRACGSSVSHGITLSPSMTRCEFRSMEEGDRQHIRITCLIRMKVTGRQSWLAGYLCFLLLHIQFLRLFPPWCYHNWSIVTSARHQG